MKITSGEQTNKDLWNKRDSVKNTNIAFHITKSTHIEIQEECKLVKISKGLFSITHHIVPTEPRDLHLSSPTTLKQNKNC